MKFILSILQRYPVQSFITLVAMLFAGIAEGFGISMLLPLLSLCIDKGAGAGHHVNSALEKAVTTFFSFFHVTPSIEMLLTFFVASIIVKVLLVLMANNNFFNLVIYT